MIDITFNELLELSGVTLKVFSDKYSIPYRTLQNWKDGSRKPPEYVLLLLEKLISQERMMKMKTYHIINTSDRSTRSELIHYSFEQVKNYFRPDKEEFPEEWEQWNAISDIADLEEFLNDITAGEEQPYQFEEDEVDSMEDMEKANRFLRSYK